jgi:type I restriction enzyme, S subunit
VINRLKPYLEYKDSGLPWLGPIPMRWEVRRAKCFLREVDERSVTGKEELLSVSHVTGVTPRREKTVTMFLAESNVGHKLCRPDDVVINTMWAWMAAMGVSRYSGIVSPSYGVYRPLSGSGLSLRFLDQLLRTPTYAAEYLRQSTGVNASRLRLYPEHFLRIPLICPPPDEQAAIVRFLDQANGRIERAIRAKRKLIALLNEQKQAIIHRVVTRGFVDHLSLNVLCLPREMKNHAGWHSFSVRRLIQRRWLEIQDGNHGELHPKASDYVESGIPFLMANNVRPFGLDLVRCAKLREGHARRLRIGFAVSGDVLLTHKATIGQVGLVPDHLEHAFVMLTPQVTYYRTLTPHLQKEFLFLYMQSPQFQEQMRILSLNQSTRPYIGILEQRNLVICFPAQAQQDERVKEYTTIVKPVEFAIARTEREIALLREYRTTLTADVVTGKLDVREAVKHFSAEAEGPLPADDLIDDIEDEAPEEPDG